MDYDFSSVLPRLGTDSMKWSHAAKTVGFDGLTPIAAGTADMDFKSAPEIISALIEYVNKGIFGYELISDKFLSTIAVWLHRHGWIDVQPDWIVPATGVIPAIGYCVQAFTEPGESVVLQPPVYFPFDANIRKFGRVPVENLLKNTGGVYTIDFDDLEEKLSRPDVKMMLLCNPHNPTGRVWSITELIRVATLCEKYDIVLVSDEIHFDLIYNGYEHTMASTVTDSISDRCVVLSAPTKTFNFPALKCSYAVIKNNSLRHKYRETAEKYGVLELNGCGIAACTAAYTCCDEWLNAMRSVLEHNKSILKDFCASELPQLRLSELEGTFLQWVDCRVLGLTDSELTALFAKTAGLALSGGKRFGTGGDGFVRINIASPEPVLQEILRRIKLAVKSVS